jgi:hypothetical protein
MGFLKRLKNFGKKVVDFERENLRHIGSGIKEDPSRLLKGAIDPFGSKLWGYDEGLVNQLGGATEQAYERAAKKGIDIGPGASMHALAGAIASSLAGGYGMNRLAAMSGPLGRIGQLGGGTPSTPGGTLTGGITDAAGNIIPGTETFAAAPRQGLMGRIIGIPEGGITGPMDVANIVSNVSNLAGAVAGPLSAANALPPVEEGVSQAPFAPLVRSRTAMPLNPKTYGKSGGEHLFFSPAGSLASDPQLPPGTETVLPPGPDVTLRLPTRGMRVMNMGGPLTSPQFVSGGGSGRDDTVEALLSDGEYVIDAESVALLGDGSLDEGARRLDQLRANLRKHKGAAMAKGKFSPDAKAPEQYMAKGGNISKFQGLSRDATLAERRARLAAVRRMLSAYQKKEQPKPGESLGYDPYNKPREGKAEGGSIMDARNRVTSIQKLAKDKPFKRPNDPVAQLLDFADRLESTIGKPESIQVQTELAEFAKGGSVLTQADILRQVMEKYRPKNNIQRSPEELRALAEELRRMKPDSDVLRQYDATQRAKIHRTR